MSLSYPDDRRYHPEHLWAQSRSDGSVLVGISNYAQDQLGAVIFVELPETGAHFTQGQSCASIESAKVTSDAVMPLSGTVLEINEALADTPELLNQSPYGEGLSLIHISFPWLRCSTALPTVSRSLWPPEP